MRKETRCRHIGYSFRLTRVLLYAPSHRQDSTYHSLCYTSCGALAGTRNSSMGPPHEGSIRRTIALWANALTTELHLTPCPLMTNSSVINLVFLLRVSVSVYLVFLIVPVRTVIQTSFNLGMYENVLILILASIINSEDTWTVAS